MSTIMNTTPSKAAGNTSLCIMDYRNGKYQGAIQAKSRLPQGFGMYLSQDYHLAIGFWKNGQLQGQSLILFPNSSVCFGTFSKNRAQQFNFFQDKNGKILYSFAQNSKESLFILEDNMNKILIVASSDKESENEFFDLISAKRLIMSRDQIQEQKRLFLLKKLQISQQMSYQDESQKWTKIQEISKRLMKSQHKGYKQFLKFMCNVPQSQIQLTQTKKQLQLRFKKSSIICQIIEANTNKNTLRLKLLGYYDENSRKMDIYRKTVPGIVTQYEQLCEEDTFIYTSKRPVGVKYKLMNYLKKSINFSNQFIKSRQFQSTKSYFECISQIIERQISSKTAQTLLQIAQPSRQLSTAQRQKYRDQLLKKKRNYHIQLSEVKNDIFQRVSKKKGENFDNLKTVSRKKYDIEQRYGQQKENYYSPQASKGNKNISYSPNLRQKKYLIYTQNQPVRRTQYFQQDFSNYDSPSKLKSKKYTYISDDFKSIYPVENHEKWKKKQQLNELYHSRSHYQYQKDQFNELKRPQEQDEKVRYKRNNHKESIENLTSDYELITQRITELRQNSNRKGFQDIIRRPNRHQISKSKSSNNYLYQKSPSVSPSNRSNKGKRQWK